MSTSSSLKEILEILPSVFHIEILLMAFHFSSEAEKASQAHFFFSSLRAIKALPSGFNSSQLSCWALLASRLVLILRHMISYPRICPSSLLLELKSKLREVPYARSHSSGNSTHHSPWAPTFAENMMGILIKERELSSSLLNQLIDVAPFPASACREDLAPELLGLSCVEICSSFSWILGFWKGKKAATIDGLVLERYIFMLCWDSSPVQSTLDNLQIRDTADIEHLYYFSRSVLGSCNGITEGVKLPNMVFDVLQQLQTLQIPDEVGELGWDFLRSYSWLSLVLSLLGGDNLKSSSNTTAALVESIAPQHGPIDSLPLSRSQKNWISSFDEDQVVLLLRTYCHLCG